MNPCDLSEILDRLGYYINDDTGEVMLEIDPCGPPIIDNLMVILAAQGLLITKRNPEFELGFYLPNWRTFNSCLLYTSPSPRDDR